MIYLLFMTLLASAQQPTEIKSENSVENKEDALTLQGSLNFRDPFKKFTPKDDGIRTDTPEIQRYAIESFKLVGVISGTKKNKAMLSGPDGKLHIVTENLKIGNRKGVVKSIEPGIVKIEEKVLNILGEEEKVESSIQFNKDKKI